MKSEQSVRDRYSAAAAAREAALCCPVDYNPEYLKAIPAEVIERDYGCGDPSRYLRPGETVLDLGSGGGKICFIAAQVVGPQGRVIGVDMNDDMLALARSAQKKVSQNLGFNNVEFVKGKIQDLRSDRDRLDSYLKERPLKSEGELREFEIWSARESEERPLVADQTVDVVVSNCVLNLVDNQHKQQMFKEIFRVLKKGGRAVISDIVADEEVPLEMQADPELWSGCISGAFQEYQFLKAFEDAGFYGVRILKRDEKPWQTVKGFEFRSLTVEAFKGKEGPCWDHHEAVIYKGPFKKVEDDDGHTYLRGERIAVCRKTRNILSTSPYAEHFERVDPLKTVSEADAKEFPCTKGFLRRDPRQTKGDGYDFTSEACETSGGCC